MGILPTKPYNRGKAAGKLHLFRRLTAPLPPWRQLLASPLAGIPIFCEDVPFKTIQPRPCRVELQFSSSNGATSRCVGNFRLARLPIFSFDAQLVHRDCHALGFPTGELATESTEEVQFCERQRGSSSVTAFFLSFSAVYSHFLRVIQLTAFLWRVCSVSKDFMVLFWDILAGVGVFFRWYRMPLMPIYI